MKHLRWGLPFLFLIFLSVGFEIAVGSGFIASYLLPKPSDMVRVILIEFIEFRNATLSTLTAAMVGLLLSILIGITFAIGLSISKVLKVMFYPYAVFFQTVPIIAVAPILVIWLGFGFSTVVACSFIVSVFPILANTLAGLELADIRLVELLKLQKVGRLKEIFILRLPGAVPQIFTGIRVATGLSLIGAIVGEFIAGDGLGGMIDLARTQQRLDKVFAAVILATGMGVLALSVIGFFEKQIFRRWI